MRSSGASRQSPGGNRLGKPASTPSWKSTATRAVLPFARARVTLAEEQWRRPEALEFFVDFETVNDCDDDFSQLPARGGQPLIFMVGCGHLEDGRFMFRCFTADALTEAAEAEVIERWLGHMEEVKRRLGFVGSPRVFHWSPAEESAYATAYNSAKARHPDRTWPDPRLFDFLNLVVRKESVVVRVRGLDRARERSGLTKAEVARRIDAKPEIVRRLLTEPGSNPTMTTVLKVAAAVGCHLELVPNSRRNSTEAGRPQGGFRLFGSPSRSADAAAASRHARLRAMSARDRILLALRLSRRFHPRRPDR